MVTKVSENVMGWFCLLYLVNKNSKCTKIYSRFENELHIYDFGRL